MEAKDASELPQDKLSGDPATTETLVLCGT